MTAQEETRVYRLDKDTDQQVEARRWALDLMGVVEAHDDAPADAEHYPPFSYCKQSYRHVSHLLAGGGPTVELHFVADDDGDLDHAYVQFIDGYGSALRQIPDWWATKLWAAYR